VLTPARQSALLGLMLLILLAPIGARATIYESSDRLHVSALHKLDEDLVAWVSNMTIDGTIDGDVIAGVYNFTNNGDITGSLNLFAYQLRQAGRVEGSMHAFANYGTIDGQVDGALIFLCSEARINQSAVIERSADIYGATVGIDGTIRGDTRVWGDEVSISGTIEGNLEVKAKHIEIYPPAVITGDFSYSTPTADGLVIHPGASIVGEPAWSPLEPDETKEESDHSVISDIAFATSKMLAGFLFGIIVVWLFRKYAQSTVLQMQTRFSASFAARFLTTLVVVVSALILVFSAVCALAGAVFIQGELAAVGALILVLSLLMVPITTFATVAGGVLFYSGKIFVAIVLGYLIVRAIKKQPAELSKTQLLLGLIFLTLSFHIPYAGPVIYLLASSVGVGAIVLGVRGCRQETGTRPESGAATSSSPTPPTL